MSGDRSQLVDGAAVAYLYRRLVAKGEEITASYKAELRRLGQAGGLTEDAIAAASLRASDAVRVALAEFLANLELATAATETQLREGLQ